MKNINVQRKVEYCQNYKKIEDLCPPVCTSIRECNSLLCPIYFPGTWEFWKIFLNTRLDGPCFCCWAQIYLASGDSGSWNVASINVPQRSSRDSLNLSEDDPQELCSECGVTDWILGGNNMGRGCCSSISASSPASSLTCSSW